MRKGLNEEAIQLAVTRCDGKVTDLVKVMKKHGRGLDETNPLGIQPLRNPTRHATKWQSVLRHVIPRPVHSRGKREGDGWQRRSEGWQSPLGRLEHIDRLCENYVFHWSLCLVGSFPEALRVTRRQELWEFEQALYPCRLHAS